MNTWESENVRLAGRCRSIDNEHNGRVNIYVQRKVRALKS